MIEFALEPYDKLIDDIKPMLPLHWKETAVYEDIPLDPDYEFFKKANELGVMIFYTARSSGLLIGYAAFIVCRSFKHKSHVWAVNDMMWVHKDRRRLGAGRGLVRFWENDLRQRGVSVVQVATRVAQPELMYLLKDEDYVTIECGLSKRL